MMQACLPSALPPSCPPSLFHPHPTSWHQKQCPFPRAAGTNYHPLGGFKQQKCVFSSSGSQESKSRWWWGHALSRGFRGGAIPSLASSSAGTCLHSLAPARISLCYLFTSPSFLSPSTPPSSCLTSLSQQVPFCASIPTIHIILESESSGRRVAFRSNHKFILLMLVASYHTTKGSFSVQMKMGMMNEECRGR